MIARTDRPGPSWWLPTEPQVRLTRMALVRRRYGV